MLVSVYIPTKNRLELLKRAIKSVKEQTYKSVEIIVVDDGSTDGTRDYLVQQMKSGNLKAIFHDESLGACAARNSAIMCAQGEFVTGLDDDDYFLCSQRIEFFLEKWKSSNSGIAGIFDTVKVKKKEGIFESHSKKIVSYKDLRQNNFVGSQIFAPRRHYLDSGLFDIAMPAWQDWDLWLRMSEKYGTFVNMNKLTYLVDELHDAERLTTRNGDNIRKAMLRLSGKINNLNSREKSSLIMFLHGYPQVRPLISEMFILLIAFRLKAVLRSARKMLT